MEATNLTDKSHRIAVSGLFEVAPGRCGPIGRGERDPSTASESVHDAGSRIANCRRILVPIKWSRHSLVGLAVALKLARVWGSRMVLLHVVHLNIAGEERGIDRTRLLQELQQAAEKELRHLAWSLDHMGDIDISIRVGNPAEVIPQAARSWGADAIVMAMRSSRSWLQRLGPNIVRTVTNHAPCAVWLAILDNEATV